jgi:Dolichyl-phosphate-mannose-protein mannosyltransferase
VTFDGSQIQNAGDRHLSADALRRQMTSRALARRIAGVRAWVIVGAFVVVSTVVRTLLAKTHPAPWIFDDELIYAQLAGSLARTGHFAVRSVPGLQGYGPGYPALIAPAYVVFDNVAHAYAAAKAINSLLMSLAAFPIYYLARRVVSHPLALLASVFSLLIPSLEYTGTIMTENAFYPAFVVCALALVSALERPTAARQLLALAAIAGAFLIRAQAVVLAAAFATAIVAFAAAEAWTDSRPGRLRLLPARLRAFAWTWGAFAIGLVLVLLVEHARGRSLGSSLGAYRDVTRWNYSVGDVARWYVRHLAELDFYLGFVPLMATIVIGVESLRRSNSDRALRAFAAVSVSLLIWVPLAASALSSHLAQADGIGRIEERDAFYVGPLCLIALLVWVERGAPRHWLVTVPAAVFAAALPWTIPYSKFVNLSALSDTLAFIPLARQEIYGNLAASHLARILGLAALAAALVFLLLPRRLAILIPVGVLAYLVIWQIPVERQMRGTSAGVLAESIGVRREWIDEAVRGRGQVAAFWTGNVNPNTIAEDEFFNGSLSSRPPV